MSGIIDLTKVLDKDYDIYHDGDYSDPEFSMEQWCSIEDQGFSVSKLQLGTQTGTHIDAPSHFNTRGDTLDKLDLNNLFGRYCYIDLTRKSSSTEESIVSRYQDENILFLFAERDGTGIEESLFEAMLALPAKVWVMAGYLSVNEKTTYYFYRGIAEKGIFLVEDLQYDASMRVTPNGTIVALPLKLNNSSGAPCRVVVAE